MKKRTLIACFIIVAQLALSSCVPIPPPTATPVTNPGNQTPIAVRGGVNPTETPEPECALEVSKDAFASAVTARRWSITKISEPVTLTLEMNQTAPVNYSVTVDTDGAAVESAWVVTGTITVNNPCAVTAPIADIVDVILPTPNITATLACEEDVPFELPAGDTLLCEYAAELPDASERLNTVTVMQDSPAEEERGVAPEPEVLAITATADVRFTDGEPVEIDECVDVSDSVGGPLGTVCATDQLPRAFTYARTVGPFAECGSQAVTNTATMTTTDTLATTSITHTLAIAIQCRGCVYSHGYWKTHADKQSNKYDEAWDMAGASGPDTVFYKSGITWLAALDTPVGGNAYHILAQQFAAAKLNLWNSAAATKEVNEAVATAEAYFAENPPLPEPANPQRAELVAIATLLDKYNNGEIGPPHCE